MSTKKTDNIVEADAFSVAENEAENAAFTYVHHFTTPFTYNGVTYDTLTFDWGSLTGRDGLAIEGELQALGKPVIIPTLSGEYLIRMAARACDKPIGADAFELMRLSDYNRIRSSARSFLLRSEL
jgi:hypothetical protein